MNDGIFTAQVPLMTGMNTLTAQVFDKAGNVTRQTLEVEFDPAVEAAYTYDDSGNLIQKSFRGEQAIYSYNYDNQLTKILYPYGSRTEYTYDTRGKRRTWDVGSGTKINYFYDGNTAIIERDEAGKTTASYTRGLSLGGGIGSIISKYEGENTYYYLYDGQGNVTHLTDEDGTVIMRYEYDAFGSIVYQDGSLENAYQYQTKEYDSQSGLVYFGARYYDPAIGRFTTPDPLGMVDGPNRYIYLNNDPVNLIDLWGLCGENKAEDSIKGTGDYSKWKTTGYDYYGLKNWPRWYLNRWAGQIDRGMDPTMPGADPEEFSGLERDIIRKNIETDEERRVPQKWGKVYDELQGKEIWTWLPPLPGPPRE